MVKIFFILFDLSVKCNLCIKWHWNTVKSVFFHGKAANVIQVRGIHLFMHFSVVFNLHFYYTGFCNYNQAIMRVLTVYIL